MRVTKKVLPHSSSTISLVFVCLSVQVEKCLRNQSKYSILDARNDGVRFTSSLLRSLSEEHLSLRDQYSSAQNNLSEEVLSIAGSHTQTTPTPTTFLASVSWVCGAIAGSEQSHCTA